MTATAYSLLTKATAEAYVRGHGTLSRRLGKGPYAVRDVADGNMNSVFVIRTEADIAGVVLKQALPWVRIHGEGWPVTPERAVAEARALRVFRTFAPDNVPELFDFNQRRYVIAMEDLADLRVWRDSLNLGQMDVGVADAMGRFVARLAFGTSELGMDPTQCRKLRSESMNSELCKITEDLVFTEPYVEHEHNWHHPNLGPLVREIRSDRLLLTEVALLKHSFMTHGEALIHGDLHTGSVMVGQGRAIAIDPEFCFFGPVGFDLGALWANFVIATVRGYALARPQEYVDYAQGLIEDSWLSFVGEMHTLWPRAADMSLNPGFLDRYLVSIWYDAIGFAGIKAIRRMIGYAHVTDIETLEEPGRTAAAATVLRIARRFILDRRLISSPAEACRIVLSEAMSLSENAAQSKATRGAEPHKQ